jgi:hypothetical protein
MALAEEWLLEATRTAAQFTDERYACEIEAVYLTLPGVRQTAGSS